MAKTKWIVPAVALMLCAVSLIGAGYAAYTATLTDNETVSADNNFVTLTMEDRTMETEIEIYYDYDIVYNGASEASRKYTPFLDLDTTLNVEKYAALGSFKIVIDDTYKGDEVSEVTKYTLTQPVITITSGTPSALDATIKVFSDSTYQTQATLTDLSEDTTYYLVLAYTQDGTKNLVETGTPSDTLTIRYTLSVAANITNA